MSRAPHHRRHAIRLFDRKISLPHSRPLRVGIGIAFVIMGLLGFLPVLGFWMIPIGLLILSIDSPRLRRLRRRTEVKLIPWWRRQRARFAAWRAGKGA